MATGTGIAALEMAKHVPQGKVIGIDFSEGMLHQAEEKARLRHLDNVEFKKMDMQAMELAEMRFDVANCSFGIFFVEDMEGQLKHIKDHLKPGGSVVCSSFAETAFLPLVEIFFERIEQYGVERPPLSRKRIADESACIELFQKAGLKNVKTYRENLGYHMDSAEDWWNIIWYAGFRGLVNQLSESELTQFKKDHLAEIEKLATNEGIWLDVEVLFTKGSN